MSISDTDQAYADVLELIHTRSLEGWDITALISELVECLQNDGMQLYRVHIGSPILHPLYAVGAYTWYEHSGVTFDTYARGAEEEESFHHSPVRPIFQSGANEGRYRISTGSDSDQYPIFISAAERGGTDYFLQLTGYQDRTGHPAVRRDFC